MKDFLGQTIEAGDKAVYVTSGRYTARMAVQIVEVRKSVSVRTLSSVTGEPIRDPFWVSGSSLAVVENFKSFGRS